MTDDFLLEDEDDLLGEYLDPEEELPEDEDDIEDSEETGKKLDVSIYEGKLTQDEVWLIGAYDDITKAENIEEAATIIVMANPQHTSSNTVGNIIKDLFHKQGHSRMQNLKYSPDSPLRGEDVLSEIEEDDDGSFNQIYAQEARDQVSRFIQYLATRDLSKDSVVSRRRKQRQIPAFIIFLFSSGMYDLIVNCPTLPEDYKVQVRDSLRKIMQAKYDIVELLAQAYDKAGRPQVAEKVRQLQLGWFQKEPAEIRLASEYRDLKLTSTDVAIYREYRGKFTNTSSAITQDVISDLIEVVVDPAKGIFEKLKDKTRTEAINDVKREYKAFVEREEDENSELAKRVIFKDLK